MPSPTYLLPWSKPEQMHEWYMVPDDDARDYKLAKRHRAACAERFMMFGARYQPTWAMYAPAFFPSVGLSYLYSIRHNKPWWFGLMYFVPFFIWTHIAVRTMRSFFYEYQFHKIITWGVFWQSYSKRRLAAGKEFPVPIAERTKDDRDGNWNWRGLLLFDQDNKSHTGTNLGVF
eukprot:Hpha_TRINITY_DN16973_c0_g4::TRINITY_DN16973_c0_g4_i1::g.54274::m.54274